MMTFVLIVLTLASLAAWAMTRNVGWALPTAVFGYILLRQFTDVWGWVNTLFWVLIIVTIIALFFAARWFARLAIIAFAAMMAIAIVVGLAKVAGAFPGNATTKVTVTTPGNPAVLTVEPGDVIPTAAQCRGGDAFSNKSLLPVGQGRLWSDSVSTPIGATAKEAQLTELLSEICVNPVLGDAYAQALADTKIGDFSVADANPWLGKFLAKSSATDQLRGWLTYKTGTDGKIITDTAGAKVIYVTEDYQKNAAMVNTLLMQFDNQGVKEGYTSTAHWPLGSLTAGNLPRAHRVTDPKAQENKPFLALTFTTKVGEECPTVLGVNTQDKRPEFVGCEQAKAIAPSTPTVVKTCAELGTCPTPEKPKTPPTKPTPPTTPPPTTPPPTTPPPSCQGKTCQTPPAPPANRPPAPAPVRSPENTPPPPPPAPATTTVPVIPAPGASSAPAPAASVPTGNGAATGGTSIAPPPG